MTNTAVILAGGKSERYGRPKGLQIIDGQTLIERLVDQIQMTGVTDIHLSTDDPEPYRFIGLKIIPDRFNDCGPLAGIHSALLETDVDSLLVLACDLPAITSKELKILIKAASDEPAMVVFTATQSQEHPLCSVVRRDLLEPITSTLAEGKHAVLRFFHSVDHRIIYFDDESPFLNMNAPDDLRTWESTNAR